MPTFRLLAISAIACVKGFPASPTVIAADTARQRWPAHPNALSLDDLRAHFEIGIRHHHNIIFRTALALHALPMRRAFRVDIAGNWRGTDEADGPHIGMMQQSVDRRFASRHQVHHSFGQPGLMQQFDYRREVSGTRSEGFSTKVLPQAMA